MHCRFLLLFCDKSFTIFVTRCCPVRSCTIYRYLFCIPPGRAVRLVRNRRWSEQNKRQDLFISLLQYWFCGAKIGEVVLLEKCRRHVSYCAAVNYLTNFRLAETLLRFMIFPGIEFYSEVVRHLSHCK